MNNTVYGRLQNNKKPRVHIKYEIETENGTVTKELPFVVGVMGDFSGDSTATKPFSERKFVQIDRDNFDNVMAKIAPELKFRVENKLTEDGSELPVHLKFSSLNDFLPENIVSQVPALQKLLDTRNKLRDLITQVDLSENLEMVLENILRECNLTLENNKN